jgi:hypothetical protein
MVVKAAATNESSPVTPAPTSFTIVVPSGDRGRRWPVARGCERLIFIKCTVDGLGLDPGLGRFNSTYEEANNRPEFRIPGMALEIFVGMCLFRVLLIRIFLKFGETYQEG